MSKISELLPVGTKLRAEYEGEFYAAEVLAVSDAKKKAKAPVKVSFLGHDSEAWVSVDQLQAKALKGLQSDKKAAPAKGKDAKGEAKEAVKVEVDLPVGTQLQALYSDDKYYAAEVVAVRKGKKGAKAPFKVHFGGQDESEDQWVGVESLRSKLIPKGATKAAKEAAPAKEEAKAEAKADLSKLTAGMKVQAQFPGDDDGAFYPAEVVEVSTAKKRAKAPVKVHYAKYEKEDDKWVSAAMLKSKAIKKVQAKAPEPEPKAKAKGGKAADNTVTYLGSKPADVKALKAMASKGKSRGKVVLSKESKLVLEGDVQVRNLNLDGTLIVRAKKTSKAIIQNLTVTGDSERVVEAGTVAISNSFTSVVACEKTRPYARIGEPKERKPKESAFKGDNPKDVEKLEKLCKRYKGTVSLTPSSTLVLKGNVQVRTLKLDGALTVEAERGAKAIIQNLAVKNDGTPDARVVRAGTVALSTSFTSVVSCTKRRPYALLGA